MIVKKNCPVCHKPAILASETSLSCGLISRKYQCGHIDIGRSLSTADFANFQSTDGFKPYKFQVEGALWAIKSGGRFLIADEMGCGKTVQALMVARYHEKELTKFLVICKAALQMQWFREVMRWCGDDWMVQIVNGENEFLLPGVKGYIVSYDMLWRFKDIPAWIKKAGVKFVIMDEVQHIKNTNTKRTNGVREAVKAVDYVAGLSGTPISNHAAEYFPVLNMLRPDKCPTAKNFEMAWVQTYFNGHTMKYAGLRDPKAFHNFTKDFIIRRTREEVLPDLPTVTRGHRFSELGTEVEEAYKQTVIEFQKYYNGNVSDTAAQRYTSITGFLSKMRHITGIAKIEPVIDFVEEFMQSCDRKITIFVHHKDVGETLVARLKAEFGEVISLTAPVDQTLIDRFKNGPVRIMVASTLAAGEGLNLQFCHDFIMMELQWTPVKEEQAEGRFVRIGQLSDKVFGTYFIAVGTIDEYLTDLREHKRAICANTLDGKEIIWQETDVIKELAEIIAMKGGAKWGW